MKRLLLAVLCIAGIALLPACRPDIKESKGNLAYFDIKGFFKADSVRLNKLHPAVTKTVIHNGVVQTKKLYIKDWGREFELFINSDINKPAWRESYTVKEGNGLLVYKAKLPDLKTKSIVIKKDGDRVKWILIYNHTKNMLYENVEKLSYFPDSVYEIQKSQKVRLMGKNLYDVKGVF